MFFFDIIFQSIKTSISEVRWWESGKINSSVYHDGDIIVNVEFNLIWSNENMLQYSIGRLIARSRKVSKPRDLYLELYCHYSDYWYPVSWNCHTINGFLTGRCVRHNEWFEQPLPSLYLGMAINANIHVYVFQSNSSYEELIVAHSPAHHRHVILV